MSLIHDVLFRIELVLIVVIAIVNNRAILINTPFIEKNKSHQAMYSSAEKMC